MRSSRHRGNGRWGKSSAAKAKEAGHHLAESLGFDLADLLQLLLLFFFLESPHFLLSVQKEECIVGAHIPTI